MPVSDPIADMLTSVRNANTAMHDTVLMPSSKLKEALAKILVQEGYIAGFNVNDNTNGPGKTLEIQLKYSAERSRTISGIKRVSKPGLRVYAKTNEIPKVLNGLGIALVSTSHGVITDKEARAKKVGGEVVAYVW